MYKTLLIGTAARGTSVASSLKAHARFDLTGIADINPEALADAGEKLAVPPEHRHTDYRQALAAGGYELAVVTAPSHLHYMITKDVLDAGLPCLTEKPFTLSLAEARELVELAAKKRLVLQVVQNYRYEAMNRKIAEIIHGGSLGRMASVTGAFHRLRQPRAGRDQGLHHPLLFVQSIHHIDWLISILPPIRHIMARNSRAPWSGWDGPSTCHLILQTDNGILAGYTGSYDARGDQTPYGGTWRVEMENGDLLADNERRLWQITEQGTKRELLLQAGEHPPSMQLLLDDLNTALDKGIEPPTSGRNNLATLQTLFDIIARGDEQN